jgi:hypothetical protein
MFILLTGEQEKLGKALGSIPSIIPNKQTNPQHFLLCFQQSFLQQVFGSPGSESHRELVINAYS